MYCNIKDSVSSEVQRVEDEPMMRARSKGRGLDPGET